MHRRAFSSWLTLAPLDRRTLAFAKAAQKATREPAWELVLFLRHASQQDPALRDILRRCGISPDEWTRWSPVVHSSTLGRALEQLQQTPIDVTPSWVALALTSHKVRSPADAQSALYDLALPLTSLPPPCPPINVSHTLPLFVLTTHSLAYFSLVALLRPLTSHLLALPSHSHSHASFHFNSLLQAISLFDRSRVAADVAVDLLKEMDNRHLALWPNTEKVLIRDNFRSPQLLEYFRRRGQKCTMPEAWLRAYASLGKVQPSTHYLHAIRKHCLESGIPPPYTTKDDLIDADGSTENAQGTAHKANTYYLRAMRDDRASTFRCFHHLLRLDLAKSHRSPSLPSPHPDPSDKSNIDIYDWTTALYAAAHDRTLSADSLLDLFRATKDGTDAYKPTRATYTVVIQGLLRKNALEDAQKLWDEFVAEVVSARGEGNEKNEMRIDRKALCVGIDVLVQSGRGEEALYLLDEAVKRDIEEATSTTPAENASSGSKPIRASTSPYLKVHPIHALLTALLRIRRPDAIFYIWTHLTSLYFVPPTNLMLRILLKAAMQASKMDGESLKGAMSWYIADNKLFKKQSGPIAPTIAPFQVAEFSRQREEVSPGSISESKEQTGMSRDTLVGGLHALFQTPTPPSVVGIWANCRSTEVARSIFRGMIFGNWPALRRAAGTSYGGGVTRGRAQGGDSVFQEFARVFVGRPDRFLPPGPSMTTTATTVMMTRPDVENQHRDGDGDGRMTSYPSLPLPTVMPSESTFAAYVALLGLSSRAEDIPEVLVWMRALNVVPKTETLAVALVFWMEVGLRGPVFEDGWAKATTMEGPPRTEYGALRAWIQGWVGEKRAPTEEDIHAGIKRVREMRKGHVTARGGG